MGVVYLGLDALGQKVAVKVVRRDLAVDPSFRARFDTEVANAQRVASFCTARVLDHGEAGGLPYLVTEYIEGPSLAGYVESRGMLPAELLRVLAIGTATALTAIHAVRLVPRDLKPRNVLLSPTRPRVIDFEIARARTLRLTTRKPGRGRQPRLAGARAAVRRAGQHRDRHIHVGNPDRLCRFRATPVRYRQPHGSGGSCPAARLRPEARAGPLVPMITRRWPGSGVGCIAKVLGALSDTLAIGRSFDGVKAKMQQALNVAVGHKTPDGKVARTELFKMSRVGDWDNWENAKPLQ